MKWIAVVIAAMVVGAHASLLWAAPAPLDRPLRIGLVSGTKARGLVELTPERDGFTKDIIQAAARGVDLRVEFVPFEDGDNETEAILRGDVDMVAPVSIVDIRTRKLTFTSPILLARGAVFYRTGERPAATVAELRKRRVGVAVWGAGQQWCVETEIPAETKSTLREALTELSQGQIDAVVSTEIAGACELERIGLKGISHVVPSENNFVRAFALVTTDENSRLISKMNTGLEMARQSGEASRIYDHWIARYQANPAPPTVPLELVLWGAGALGLVLAASGLAYALTRVKLASRSRALALSQEQYRLMTENLGGVAFCIARRGSEAWNLTFSNSLYAQWQVTFPDFSLEAALPGGICKGTHPEDRERVLAALNESLETCAPFGQEFRLADRLGQYHWIHARAFPSAQPEGVLWQGILLDVTEARQLAESLKENELKFREIVENCQDGIIVVTTDDGTVLEANQAALELMSLSREKFVGSAIQDLFPDLRFVIRPSWNGSEELKVNWHPLGGGARQFEARLKSVRLGDRSMAIVLLRDVTERERLFTERARLDLELGRTQKLEGLGVMAGGIAHFFNNVLVSVLGNLSLVSRQIIPGSEAAQTLSTVQRSATRAAELTSKLLAYSGGGTIEQKPVELTQLVRNAHDLLEVTAGHQCRVIIQSDSTPLPVSGDTVQLEQVLMNLVRNAVESITHSRGEVVIRLERRVIGPVLAGLVGADAPFPGDYACVRVTDNGSGIAGDVAQHMFEPFFSTKFAGRGLGLAACLGVVRAHHGYMAYHTTPGSGSSFEVILPLRQVTVQTQIESKPLPSVRQAPPNCRTVMVVDDEQLVRDTVRNMLRALGIHVIEVESGERAIDRLRSGAAPDCVVLDMTMPGMSGVQALAEIRRLCPDLRVIMCSGYSATSLEPWVMVDPLVGFLAKPYTLDELAAMLAEISSRTGPRSADAASLAAPR